MGRTGLHLGSERLASVLSTERRAVAGLLLAFWIAFQIIFFTYGTLDGKDEVSPEAWLTGLITYVSHPSEIAIVAIGALLCLAIYGALRRVRIYGLWKQLLATAGLALVGAACFSIAVSLICEAFGVGWPRLTPRFFLVDTLRWLAPFGLWAGIALTVTYNGEVRERERRLALFQAQAQDAQMRALRYQVNPHLLYNTLNSIASLILDGKNELAEAMVMRLSSFFRASLSNDPHADVSLAEEVALQQLYLEIEQMRFPNLTCSLDVPDDLNDVRVPSLILQPLIENVLKHGINPDGQATHLSIRGRRVSDGFILLEVRDSGPGTSANSGTGVGLRNVEGRLRSRFGEAGRVETQSRPGEGFQVLMTIPAGRS
jgi:signal transduction histidine kinase